MKFKKTIKILLIVCIVASLAAITVNAARSSTANTHVYSSSSNTGNISGIVGNSPVNVYSAGIGSNSSISHQQLMWLRKHDVDSYGTKLPLE